MDKLKSCAAHLLEVRPEEDVVDRTNNSITTFILYAFAILIFAKEYGPASEPMSCWSQAEWSDDWMEYTHDYCFVESTYYVPINETVPVRGQRNNGSDRLSYYQWVPFILVAMALFNQWPHFFWRFFNMLSNKNIGAILGQASAAVRKEDERKIAAGIGRHLLVVLLAKSGRDPMLLSNGKSGKSKRLISGLWHQVHLGLARYTLALGYLLSKMAYLLTNIVQFKFISLFLGIEHTAWWGWETLNSFMTHGTAWELNGLFPRVSLCDLTIRQTGEHFHNYTVQCVLMANYLNEKIFTVLYCWFVLMALLSLVNLIQWAWTLVLRSPHNFVRQLVELSIMQLYPDPDFEDLLMVAEEEKKPSSGMEAEQGERPRNIHGEHNPIAAAISNSTTATYVSSDSGMTISSTSSTAQEGGIEANPAEGASGDADGGGPMLSPTSAGSLARREQEKGPSGGAEDNAMTKALARMWDSRDMFYRDFKYSEKSFLQLLGTDGVLIFKLMCSNANLQMSSLIMGEMFRAFHDHEMAKKRKNNNNNRRRPQEQLPPV